mmetsp:Transcript_20799/g.84688  ORF Transcript_20799/g.84688 Transcript_20799/m.84688 type:complete len:341 (+) Transcript_20799:3228-4250(+)|eukprot:CAMPEP_0113958416 /NCGR_PEP_ID=MMETSP0011_2-20120614/3411_1 /TAXON_ID=101924 /ORGANISM="Rhodosorus marinus" /LENGTH=340 /DNA_ID=CAMNT_0000969283 /DNA_START=925 /DNA_END=1947 /DNA_ORIENTATION=- /assembly_acc=CAM_ASM_000156
MRLPSKPPETNAQAILLEAVPNCPAWLREAGLSVSSVTTEGGGNIRSSGGEVRSSKGLKSWPYIEKSTAKALDKLGGAGLLGSLDGKDRDTAEARLEDAKKALRAMKASAEKKKSADVISNQIIGLRAMDDIASIISMRSTTPRPVPDEFSKLPKLFGHADVELLVGYKTPSGQPTKGKVLLELDGFSSPISAGSFASLVKDGKYDGLKIKIEDEVLVETEIPKQASPQSIPIEILVQGMNSAEYGTSLEEAGLFNERPVLPFNAYGTLALSHPSNDLNSQGGFFFVKTDPTETPAGLNLLDGNYAVVGYVIDGQTVLSDLRAGDSIVSAKLVGGVYDFI